MKATTYRPAVHVLDRLGQVDFVAVVGPTAAGKTTMIKTAMQQHPELKFVLNHTSRARRPDEVEGTDYLFKTKEEMEARIEDGGYVQVAPSLFGDLYATPPESYATEGVSVLAVLAKAIPVFRALPFRSCRTIFVVPPSWEDWQRRLKSHRFTAKQLKGRLAEAKASLKFALKDNQTRFVISSNVAQAGEDFAVLAQGQPLSERLEADQIRARSLVRNLIDKLND